MDLRDTIEHNNKQVRAATGALPSADVLLALAYEVQSPQCNARIDTDLDNCPRCSCAVGTLRELASTRSVRVQVTSSCQLRERYVDECHAKLVVFVAPVEELGRALRDIRGTPVYCVAFPEAASTCPDGVRKAVEQSLEIFCGAA